MQAEQKRRCSCFDLIWRVMLNLSWARQVEEGVNLRVLDASTVTISLDETTTIADVDQLLRILNGGRDPGFTAESLAPQVSQGCGVDLSFSMVEKLVTVL